MMIRYSVNRVITAEQFIGLLQQTTLGKRRPLDNQACIQGMLDHADLTLSAWMGDKLVGISRSVTDFYYCCYLSDLAVAEGLQSSGIGKELIRRTCRELHKGCQVILLAAPQAVGYYPRVGFIEHNSCWTLSGEQQLL